MNKYWQQLSPRDRKILLGSLPVVIILGVLLAARPLVNDRARATEELDRALEDLAWLQAQQETMALLEKGCSGSAWTEEFVRQVQYSALEIGRIEASDADAPRVALAGA